MFKALICDLDNTLYDWVGFFVPSFYAMVEKVVEITECDRDKLLDDFRSVHQKHHDSEHPFALLETRTITEMFSGYSRAEILNILDPAFHAYNSTRKKTLKLHRGVLEAFDFFVAHDINIIAHTESKLYAVVYRLRRLGLHSYFSKIYCRERSISADRSQNHDDDWLRDFPMYKVIELSMHQKKPDAKVLLEICERERLMIYDAAYVGDSIARDILMAKDAGVFSIWAAYGAQYDPEMYEKLVRITHWTVEDVKQEHELRERAEHVKPDFVVDNLFSDILPIFQSSVSVTDSLSSM